MIELRANYENRHLYKVEWNQNHPAVVQAALSNKSCQDSWGD